jgi:hypothetical protein
MGERVRTDLAGMEGLLIGDSLAYPHPVELTRWREAGLIAMDLDRGVCRLTQAGKARLKACCATCGSWRRRDDLPNAAGGPVGECHHEERIDDSMRRLRAPLSHYYESCEVHWPREREPHA